MHKDVFEVRGITLWQWEICAGNFEKELFMLTSFFPVFIDPIVFDPNQFEDPFTSTSGSVAPGTPGKDVFFTYEDTSGDIFQGLADTIDSFDANEDTLWIPEGLTYAGNTMAPSAGTYSVWMKDGNYVVTWQKETGGWSDTIVKGDSPVGKIEAVIPDDTIINTHGSGLGPTTMYGTAATDVFQFNSNTTGDVYQGKADTVRNFDEDHDFIHIPEGLVYGGATNSPSQGEYTVWEKDNDFVVTWYDNGYRDVVVEGDNPLGDILSGGDLQVV